MKTNIIIVGAGVAGLFAAIHLPKDKQIVILTKDEMEHSDSYLAQGGICVLKNNDDYDSYFEDTMRAGHYENNPQSVDIMIRSSKDIINELISLGVSFETENGQLVYTREGAHSTPRIVFHEDITGKEITTTLLKHVEAMPNVTFLEKHRMIDLIVRDNECLGVVCTNPRGETRCIQSDYTILASGGIGGLYKHSTNYRCLTGDALAISMEHGIKLKNIDYIQIHPTTLYSNKPGRRFLISESVRGEGAVLLNKDGKRFVNELLPRDVVTNAIYEQMKKDDMPYVRLSLAPIPEETIKHHFPNIYKYCLEEGYDVTKECIPVVPAQHYFMGGIDVDLNSKTSMGRLYAAGETSCNGVHGKNRLASNSLLESLVFAKRAAQNISGLYMENSAVIDENEILGSPKYKDREKLISGRKKAILDEIERMKEKHEQNNNDA